MQDLKGNQTISEEEFQKLETKNSYEDIYDQIDIEFTLKIQGAQDKIEKMRFEKESANCISLV